MKHKLLLMLCMAIAGCGGNAEKNVEQNKPTEERPETKKIEAADAVGYDGKAIRKNVDKMLNDNDKKQKELEEMQK